VLTLPDDYEASLRQCSDRLLMIDARQLRHGIRLK
jgi:hypothetical protein